GDLESGLTWEAVGGRPEPHHDVPQHPVIDVQHAAPGDRGRVDVQCIAAVQVVVQHRRQLVVCGRDGVHVTGQVQVQPFHRYHLAVPAAGRTALDAQGRAHRGLPDGDGGVASGAVQALSEAD